MFQIAIDTDTMPVSPAVYADEYRGRALPTVLPLVQGFRGNLRVYFLGEHAPSENAAVALYLRALQSKEKLVQTGLGTRGISDAGNVYYDVPLAADTTALSAVLGNRENVIMRAGIVANDVTASPQTNFEWQLNIAVSASAVGTGEKPPVSPNAIEEHNNDVAAHPFILQKIAAAEVDVSGLRTSIAGVSESLNATNTNLNNAKSELSTEISEVSAALNAETIARENEDAAIRAALESETTARSEAIEEERNALVNTATGLQNSINSERVQRLQSDAQLSSRIITEANCRLAADSEIRAALTEEETARSEYVAELRSEVFAEISNVSASLAAETTARESEDASIRAALETERSERLLQDVIISEALTSEQSERIKRDSELTKNIGVFNLNLLRISENVVKLCTEISSERTCRTAADNALRGSINTLNSDVAAIEGNIRTLENKAAALSEHTVCSELHWSFDRENNLIRKEVADGKGLAIVSKDEYSCFGIFFMPPCGCFSPNGSLIKFSKNGCILINPKNGFNVTSSSSSGGGIFIGPEGSVSISSANAGILIGSERISISSGSEISLSTDTGNISLLTGGDFEFSRCGGARFYFIPQSGFFSLEAKEGHMTLIQNDERCLDFKIYRFCIDNFDAVKFSSKNYNDEIGNYAFCATAVSLCRSGGNVLQGNSSQTALYFGTTAFATSKIDSGARVVCFGNPLGKVNIKAGNGGRIDICATCVYVNGVKIST